MAYNDKTKIIELKSLRDLPTIFKDFEEKRVLLACQVLRDLDYGDGICVRLFHISPGAWMADLIETCPTVVGHKRDGLRQFFFTKEQAFSFEKGCNTFDYFYFLEEPWWSVLCLRGCKVKGVTLCIGGTYQDVSFELVAFDPFS